MAVSLPAGLDAVSVTGIDEQINKAIDKKLKEERERGKSVKMTWTSTREAWARVNRATNAQPVGTEGMDTRLPGMWFERMYFLQNGRIYLSNGHEISLKEIPDRARIGHSCAICELRMDRFDDEHQPAFKPCTMREIIARMVKAMNEVAVEYDPSLCTHCYRFSSDIGSVMAMHLFKEHPEVVMAEVGRSQAPQPDRPVAASSPAPSPSSGSFSVSTVAVPGEALPPAQPTVVAPPQYTATSSAAPTVAILDKPRALPRREAEEPGKAYQCHLCEVSSKTQHGLNIHLGRNHKNRT